MTATRRPRRAKKVAKDFVGAPTKYERPKGSQKETKNMPRDAKKMQKRDQDVPKGGQERQKGNQKEAEGSKRTKGYGGCDGVVGEGKKAEEDQKQRSKAEVRAKPK